MSILKNNKVIAVGDVNTYHPPILSCMWSDHIINDIQWLRADTFSWHSGDVYTTVYDKLVEEYATGTTVTESSITFKRTTNGFKIAEASQESVILNKYNADGIAWYYILDTTNQRFKLPRTKFGFEGLRTNVGDDIVESLPNIKGRIEDVRSSGGGSTYSSGSLVWIYNDLPWRNNVSEENVGTGGLDLDASLSSSTYQDNAPVQERATQMYLYFYVGEYAQSAIEQTAGLNAELFNNKMDRTYNNATYQPVNKAGDTMTGALSISNTSLDGIQLISDNSLDGSGNNCKAIYFKKDRKRIGLIQSTHFVNGNNMIELGLFDNNGSWKDEFKITYNATTNKVEYNKPQIITDYVNGTSGYRIWSNGYCEQWGQYYSSSTVLVTINLLKTFKNTNYIVTGCIYPSAHTYYYQSHQGSTINTKNTSSFTKDIGEASTYQWKASGYLAAGQY